MFWVIILVCVTIQIFVISVWAANDCNPAAPSVPRTETRHDWRGYHYVSMPVN